MPRVLQLFVKTIDFMTAAAEIQLFCEVADKYASINEVEKGKSCIR